jgi:cytochrome P450
MVDDFAKALNPNLCQVNGDSWSRQRRLIAPNFNERISGIVWTESSVQARQMEKYLLSQPNGETNQSMPGLKSVAINVLAKAGYDQPQSWNGQENESVATAEKEAKDEKNSLFEAITIMVRLLIPAAVISSSILRLPFMPKELQDLGKKRDEFPQYARKLLRKEREIAAKSSEPRRSFLGMLATLEDQGGSNGDKQLSVSSQVLSEDEIRGNLFAFSTAGFETTANTLCYAVSLLAIYPHIQSWIQEELDVVFSGLKPEDTGDYDLIFPRLSRCLALMVASRFFVGQSAFKLTLT